MTGLNYFQLFSLSESFQVPINDLEQAYKQLQEEFHPDRYINADDSVRLQALQQTSLINDAYETLKSPLKRAAYLLALADIDPEEHNQAHLQEEFLIQQLQLREAMELLLENEDVDGLDTLKTSVNLEKQELLAQFEAQYQAEVLTEAKSSYNKLQFLYKLLDEIDSAEEKLLDF